jgi:chromosome segregation ATPase
MDIKSPFNACMHREYCQSEIDRLRAEILYLQKEKASLKEELGKQKAYSQDMVATYHSLTQQLAAAKEYAERLRDAISTVVEENGHLADGDVCTLRALTLSLALPKPWEPNADGHV